MTELYLISCYTCQKYGPIQGTFVQGCIYTPAYIHQCIYTRAPVYIYTSVQIYTIYTSVHTLVYIYTSVCTYTRYTRKTYICMEKYIVKRLSLRNIHIVQILFHAKRNITLSNPNINIKDLLVQSWPDKSAFDCFSTINKNSFSILLWNMLAHLLYLLIMLPHLQHCMRLRYTQKTCKF